MTWTTLWDKIVDSSLWEEDLNVRILFVTMLALRGPDHIVRMRLDRLAKKANLDSDRGRNYELVKGALEVLKSPDKLSFESQEYEGRRVKEVEEGWLILNGEKYYQQMLELNRRASAARRMREHRARLKSGRPLPGEAAAVAADARGDVKGAEAIAEAALPLPVEERTAEEIEQERAQRDYDEKDE
jgi:hypothetical protein